MNKILLSAVFLACSASVQAQSDTVASTPALNETEGQVRRQMRVNDFLGALADGIRQSLIANGIPESQWPEAVRRRKDAPSSADLMR